MLAVAATDRNYPYSAAAEASLHNRGAPLAVRGDDPRPAGSDFKPLNTAGGRRKLARASYVLPWTSMSSPSRTAVQYYCGITKFRTTSPSRPRVFPKPSCRGCLDASSCATQPERLRRPAPPPLRVAQPFVFVQRGTGCCKAARMTITLNNRGSSCAAPGRGDVMRLMKTTPLRPASRLSAPGRRLRQTDFGSSFNSHGQKTSGSCSWTFQNGAR